MKEKAGDECASECSLRKFVTSDSGRNATGANGDMIQRITNETSGLASAKTAKAEFLRELNDAINTEIAEKKDSEGNNDHWV